MNNKMHLYVLGNVMKVEALFMLPALVISLWLGERRAATSFIFAIMILSGGALALTRKKPENRVLYAKEGLIIAATSWFVLSFFGALPFYFSGSIPSFLNCIFETVSGFTTTGASILSDVEILPRGILFWRSFTHWIGGMGVLVFVLSIISFSGGYSLHIMKAESPGPVVGKFVPKLKQSAKILYIMYVVLTLIEIFLLCAGKMPLFDSLLLSFGTAGTGGFSIRNASVGAYNNAYYEYVIGIFMILFGINFNAYYFIWIKKFKDFFRHEEMRVYIGIIGAAVLMIMLNTYKMIYPALSDAFRYAFFQVSSIITTTGYATADFDKWPEFSRTILLMLMLCGACAGSTGGGIKVSRVIIAFKSARREFKRLLHPRAVEAVRIEGKPVEEETITMVNVFLIIYTGIFLVSLLIVSLNGYSFDTSFSAVCSCLNNIGPGLGLVGPAGNFGGLSAISRIVLIFDMLIGRLEIFPILMIFSMQAWAKDNLRNSF